MSSSPLHKSCQSSPWGQNWPHPGNQYSLMYYGKNLLKPYLVFATSSAPPLKSGQSRPLKSRLINSSHRLIMEKNLFYEAHS